MFIDALISFLLSGLFENFEKPPRLQPREVIYGEPVVRGGDLDGTSSVQAPYKIHGERESIDVIVSAQSALVVDTATGRVLYAKNQNEQRSLASITKLMTALVFLENNPGWGTTAPVKEEYKKDGGAISSPAEDVFTAQELFDLMLIGSKNDAARTLVDTTGLSHAEFVKKMNLKAQQLGLSSTVFVDPTGLYSENVSSAADIAKLLSAALEHEEVRQATTTRFYFGHSNIANDDFVEANTNLQLLDSFLNINGNQLIGGKTGFITEAGYCLTSSFKNTAGHEVIAVVLGSQDVDARHQEVKSLVSWVFDNFEWR